MSAEEVVDEIAAGEPGLEEALKIVRSPQFNTNPTQRLVDETLVRVIYPVIAKAAREAYAPPPIPADAPRMLGNANEEVVRYWQGRALLAEAELAAARRSMVAMSGGFPQRHEHMKPKPPDPPPQIAGTFRPRGRWG